MKWKGDQVSRHLIWSQHDAVANSFHGITLYICPIWTLYYE